MAALTATCVAILSLGVRSGCLPSHCAAILGRGVLGRAMPRHSRFAYSATAHLRARLSAEDVMVEAASASSIESASAEAKPKVKEEKYDDLD